MEVCCSFRTLVGGPCTFDRRNIKYLVDITPLTSCVKDISGHKSLFGFQDVENEIELILARARIFEICPSTIASLTICPSHRSNLGIGWIRSKKTCCVPTELSRHHKGKFPKADRGISKLLSQTIMDQTGVFVPVGLGKQQMYSLPFEITLQQRKNK